VAMRTFGLVAAALALGLGSTVAHAQTSSGSGTATTANLDPGNANANTQGDSFQRDTDRARDDVIAAERAANAKPAHSSPSVPAAPGEVIPGSPLRDIRGALIGTIDSVDMASAVVATSAGKVSVPLEAFGKNRNGLLLAVKKDEFEARVAAANKPAPAAH
jgi:hypothetical protein